MGLQFLDPYRETPSVLHSLDARFKLVFALGLLLIINLTPIMAWPAHLLYLLFILALCGLGRLPLKSLFGRSMIGLSFVLMASLGLPFVRQGQELVSLSLPWGALRLTDVGMLRFANVLVKGWLSLLVSITLVLSTHFVEIAKALQSLGLPAILASTVLLMYRYIFVLVDEAQRLLRAREARSGEAEGARAGGGLFWRAQVAGRMIGTLFLRTYERSERIYQAMLARGYDGEIRTLQQGKITKPAFALGSVSFIGLLLIAFLAIYYAP